MKPILLLGITAIASIQPITCLSSPTASSGPPITIVPQNDSICNAGTTQFTGRVDIGGGRKMFYWFFENRIQSTERPTVVYLNGGPGASSLTGLFNEVGACTLNLTTNVTENNSDSWANFVNLLFLDQPFGVGFSTGANQTFTTNIQNASLDFRAFLRTFENELPQYMANGLYLAGESFAGMYIPHYAADIIADQRANSSSALKTQIKGAILENAIINRPWTDLQEYTMFCTDSPQSQYLRFNTSDCDAMRAAMPECERQGGLCASTTNGSTCTAAATYCQQNIAIYFIAEQTAGRFSSDDLRKPCLGTPLCQGPNGEYNRTQDYLNRPEIQGMLHLNEQIVFQSIAWDLFNNWTRSRNIFLTTSLQLTYLLDQGGIDLLVLNGNLDVTVNSPGTYFIYQRLPWHRQAEYNSTTLSTWFWNDTSGVQHTGGQIKGVKELIFVGADNAGHYASADQRPGVASVVSRWLNGTLLS